MRKPAGGRAEAPRDIELPVLSPFAGASLEPHGDYEALGLVDLDLAGQVADDAAFLGCRLERCGLDGVSMRRVRVSECLLAEVHAASLDVADSTWRDSLVVAGRLGALLAGGAAWSGVRVRGGKLDLVDLHGARLAHVAFEGCVIGELDLGEAQARALTVDGCEIGILDVTGARLSSTDLAGARIGTVRGIAGLRGATVSTGQLLDLAPLLAAHAGLVVRDD